VALTSYLTDQTSFIVYHKYVSSEIGVCGGWRSTALRIVVERHWTCGVWRIKDAGALVFSGKLLSGASDTAI
jgi:hypothetical protein